MSNTTRITRNTLALYFRQILIMLVSLYTVRVVLATLGAEDYGIYNVVAGVVTMFGFLSNSMATATQRYLSFELGQGDMERLRRVFSVSLIMYAAVALVILLLAETAGLWFVRNKLTIPAERKDAALMVYHFAILSFLLTILTAPYMAVIIAHENMSIYAYVSILEAVVKLVIVFVLRLVSWDHLTLYGILICAATFLNTLVYRIVCMIKYKDCRFKFYYDKKLYGELIGYVGFDIIGSLSIICKTQGTDISLNLFFGPVVNAARGIAAQVQNAVTIFSNNFVTAVRPQIVKSYAAGQRREMMSLVFQSAKGSFFLMFIFTLPLLFETPLVLSLWLKEPPEYTVVFVRLVLLEALIDSVSRPLPTMVHATGNIKVYNVITSAIRILNFPLSLLALFLGAEPYAVMVIAIIMSAAVSIAQFIMLRKLVDFSTENFIRQVIAPLIMVSAISIMPPFVFHAFIQRPIIRFAGTTIVSVLSIMTVMYICGLSGEEKVCIKRFVTKKIIMRG